MQLWSWVLLMTFAAVLARPDGRPPLEDEHLAVVASESEIPLATGLTEAQGAVKQEEPKPEAVQAAGDDVKPGAVHTEVPAAVAVPDTPKEAETMKPMPEPVPIEPDVMAPEDSKVFPEGSLRSPAVGNDDDGKAGLPGLPGRTARTYLRAEARVGDGEGPELNLASPQGTLLLPYYGGAKGQYLIVTEPIDGLAVQKYDTDGKKKKKKKKKPGNKEEEEEEEGEDEDVGEEVNEERPPAPPSDSSDTVTITQPPPNASMAEARPVAVAVAGEGGVAAARPTGTAVVGPGGLAVSRPVATAIAGIQGAEFVVAAAGQPPGPAFLFHHPGAPLGTPLTHFGAPLVPVAPVYGYGLQPVVRPTLHATDTTTHWIVYPSAGAPPYPYAYL